MIRLILALLLLSPILTFGQIVAEYNYVASTAAPGDGDYGVNGFFLDSDGRGFTVSNVKVDTTYFFDSAGRKYIVKSKSGSSPFAMGLDAVGHATSPSTGTGQLTDLTSNGLPYYSGGVSDKVVANVNNTAILKIDSTLNDSIAIVQDSILAKYKGGVIVKRDTIRTPGGSGGGSLTDAEIETAYNNQVSVIDQSTAETGTSTDVYRWTPERVKQAIDANAAGLNEEANVTGGENLYQIDGTTTANEIADYLSGVRIPVSQNYKTTDTIDVNTILGTSTTINFWRKGDGTAGSDMDEESWWDQLWIPGVTYYVDPLAGDNFNTGKSRSDAFETYSFAESRGDVENIMLSGTVYPGVSWETSLDTFCIRSYNGRAVVGNFAAEKTWTSTGVDGVYKAPISDTLSVVLDLLNKDDLGAYKAFTKKGTSAELENSPGTYFYNSSADSVYVHASDGSIPSTYTNILIVESGAERFGVGSYTFVKDIDFYGRWTFDGASDKYYFRNCNFFHTPANDLISFSGSGGEVIISNGNFGHCINDCIDYDAGVFAIEHNMKGRYAGQDVSGSDNQLSTAHGGAKVLTVNCDYGAASNQTILDVNSNTRRLILFGKFGSEWNGENSSTFTIGVGNASGNFAQMWVEGAKVGGNAAYDFSANYGNLFLRNVPINSTTRTNVTNGGTINSY